MEKLDAAAETPPETNLRERLQGRRPTKHQCGAGPARGAQCASIASARRTGVWGQKRVRRSHAGEFSWQVGDLASSRGGEGGALQVSPGSRAPFPAAVRSHLSVADLGSGAQAGPPADGEVSERAPRPLLSGSSFLRAEPP